MSVITGKDAYVNGVPCTSAWGANFTAAIQRYAASCTHGGTSVVEGNINWSGSMAGLGASPPVALIPGGPDFSFLGVVDNKNGDALDLNGTARVNQLAINFPVAGGGPINWNASFGVQGQLARGTTGGVDTSEKLAQSAKASTIIIDPDGTPLIPEEIQNITLTMRAPERTYVSGGAMKRATGNLEVDLSFQLINRDLFVAGYQPNDRKIVRVLPDAAITSKYWLLDQIVFGGMSGFNVSVGAQNLVGYTVNGMWSATSLPATDRLGWIHDPEDNDWFGVDNTGG